MEEDDSHQVLVLSPEKVRGFLDGDELDDLETALDHAQGDVMTGRTKEYHILIVVRR